eukprot:3052259-Pyramimonas_sp.AAC.1
MRSGLGRLCRDREPHGKPEFAWHEIPRFLRPGGLEGRGLVREQHPLAPDERGEDSRCGLVLPAFLVLAQVDGIPWVEPASVAPHAPLPDRKAR